MLNNLPNELKIYILNMLDEGSILTLLYNISTPEKILKTEKKNIEPIINISEEYIQNYIENLIRIIPEYIPKKHGENNNTYLYRYLRIRYSYNISDKEIQTKYDLKSFINLRKIDIDCDIIYDSDLLKYNNLKRYEYFINLKHLFIRNYKYDLNCELINQLQVDNILFIRCNKLKNIDKLYNIKKLYIKYCDLTEIPKVHDNLELLDVSFNKITHITNINTSKIKKLNISDNPIDEIKNLNPELMSLKILSDKIKYIDTTIIKTDFKLYCYSIHLSKFKNYHYDIDMKINISYGIIDRFYVLKFI